MREKKVVRKGRRNRNEGKRMREVEYRVGGGMDEEK